MSGSGTATFGNVVCDTLAADSVINPTAVTALTANTTLTAAQIKAASGTVYSVELPDKVLTLTSDTACIGAELLVYCAALNNTGTTGPQVTLSGATFIGTILANAASAQVPVTHVTATFKKNTALGGDFVRLRCLSATKWFIEAVSGANGGIETS